MQHSTGVAYMAESQVSFITWKGCHPPRVQPSMRYQTLHRLGL